MHACRARVAVIWRLFACILAIGRGAGTDRRLGFAHAISQSHKFRIHDAGTVDVVMSIVFHFRPGQSLSGSYKSILSDISSQSLLDGRVVATDGMGRGLPVNVSNRDGWARVDFAFAETVNGSITPKYMVNLSYTVLNGICAGDKGFERFAFPWAHRWATPVTDSAYEIEFANPNMDLLMDAVCFGSSGLKPKCGRRWLDVRGTRATYEVRGSRHGAFFEWAGISRSSGRRSCSSDQRAEDEARTEESTAEKVEDTPSMSMAFTVGIVTLSSSCLFAGAACACAAKLPVKTKELEDAALSSKDAKKPAGKKRKSEDKGDILVEVDLETGCAAPRPESMVRGDAGAGVGSCSPGVHRQIGGSPAAWAVMNQFDTEELPGPLAGGGVDRPAVRATASRLNFDSIARENTSTLVPVEFPSPWVQPPASALELGSYRASPSPPQEVSEKNSEAFATPSNQFKRVAPPGSQKIPNRQGEWEVMDEFHAEDVPAHLAIIQTPVPVSTMTEYRVAEAVAPDGDSPGKWLALDEHPAGEHVPQCRTSGQTSKWQAMDEYDSPEARPECRSSLQTQNWEAMNEYMSDELVPECRASLQLRL